MGSRSCTHGRGARRGDDLVRRGPQLTSFGVLVVVLLAIGCRQSEPPAPVPPPRVEVAPVQQQDVPIYREWVATLDGYVNAQIQPQVTGYLLRQDFREGSFVRKDEILFEIDPRPFQATLDQTRAQLAQSEANESKTARDVERDTPLAAARAIPRSQLDNDIQAHRAAVAAVEAARAQVRLAELNLSFTRVLSLIDGIVGITQVPIGNLVTPTSVLTTVSQIEPIKAYFAISEQEYLSAAERLTAAAEGTLPPGASRIPFQLILSDGTAYPHPGSFLIADRQVDPKTGTIRIATVFPNPNRVLRPGQFGRVRAAPEVRRGALLVPQRAVSELQGSYQVAVVGDDSKVSIRPVTVGPRVDSMWLIEQGLRPGERVVVEGTQKVRDGMTVAATTYQPPAAAR
jgi:membrane fusion protein (multidrug efflux system)